MADIDLATLTPRARLSGDHVVVYRDAVTDEIGIIPVTDFLSAISGLTGKLLFNDAGQPVVASDVEIEGGQLRLPVIATPAVPAAGGVKLFGTSILGAGRPAFLGVDGRERVVQNHLGDFNAYWYFPGAGSGAALANLPVTFLGTGAVGAYSLANLHTIHPRAEATAGPATNAVCGLRTGYNFVRIGADASAPGGFLLRAAWGPATGVSNGSHRAFCGMIAAIGAPTDVDPSTLTNMVGMGYDATDANIQFMHNDGTGAATKIDLGPSFPKPSADRTDVYELQMFSPNDATQSVSYRVIRYDTSGKTIAAEATGTVTTDLPAATQLLALRAAMSVGGVSSVVGISVFGFFVATEY